MDFYPHDLVFGSYSCGDKDLDELIHDFFEFKLLDSMGFIQFPMLDQLFCHNFVEFGLTLVLFSLFIKLALAPFHLWGRLKTQLFSFLENLYSRDISIDDFWKVLLICFMYDYINSMANKYRIMKLRYL